ncbi:MAG: phenylalanine--tRNA ligase subunit beta [Bacteroidia bacterium]|nr:phenylalanine--tRNA ligase subunit beta [Bacteroidia bacterium]
MIFSYNWLKTLIDVDLDADQLSELLTDTGLEVEKVHKIESVKGGLKGLVVGEVVTCEKAENSDKLNLTTVNVGGEEHLPIVCGAPNVAAGLKVVIAPVGATVYPLTGEPFKIKKAKIRGNVSEGMICAEDEIGLGSDHDGIMVLDKNATPGTLLTDLIDLKDDYQIEIGLTPNRGDAASHLGTARDIQAMTQAQIQMPALAECPPLNKPGISVSITDPELCPRYTGILLTNVSVKESPDWLKERLTSIDLKPINNVVDTTNFVLHELGQPIHAFDADKIEGEIIVRKSTNGETITTLDEEERKLSGNELLITDSAKPLALAGVFGGHESGVTESTTNVFIESAYFDPAVVRKSAKTHGLNTDASFRYERGCDPNITEVALKRVVYILREVAGAEIASDISDFYPTPIQNATIDLNIDWLNRFCGTKLTAAEVEDILVRLDMTILQSSSTDLQVSVPPYRSDVLRNIDLAEEVLRIYGYNNVEIPTRLSMTPAIQPDFNPLHVRNQVADLLVSKGFHETMSNSQTKKNEETTNNPVELLNPLSVEQAIMRTNMNDGILGSIAYNINRKNKDVLFFEFGKTYFKTESGFSEQNNLALAVSGLSNSTNWNTPGVEADYFFLKGILESLAYRLGVTEKKLFKCLRLEAVNKATLKSFGIKQPVYMAVINWDNLLNQVKNVRFSLDDVPVFPVVTRDLSLVLDQTVQFKEVERLVKEVIGNYLKTFDIFDVYEGDKLEDGKKSYAISVKLYDSVQTMTDKKIDKLMEKLMTRLESQVNAVIRK